MDYLSDEIKDYIEKVEKDDLEVQKREMRELRKEKRFRLYSPDQHSILEFNPDKLFPEGCFERFLVNTLKKLDISEFSVTHLYDNGGKEEYNPRSLLGLLFYGISDGVFSARRLAIHSLFDSRYVYVSGGATPDHSTISRFLNRYGSQIVNLFTQVLFICSNVGYIDYKLIATDGTKIKAYASSAFTGTIELFKKRRKRLKDKIKLAISKCKQAESKDEQEYWKKKEENYIKKDNKISAFLSDVQAEYNSRNKEVKKNITDPDCRIMKDKTSYVEGYNAQVSACSKHSLVTAFEVTNKGNDVTMLPEMIEKTAEEAPEKDKQAIGEATMLGDHGYYSIDTLIYCDENNINAYLADTKDAHVYIDKEDDSKADKSITSKDCTIKKTETGAYEVFCPGGYKLEARREWIDNEDKYNIYLLESRKLCETCDYYERCQKKLKNQKEYKIKEKVVKNFNLIEQMHSKLRTDQGRRIYSKRMPTVERIFGHIKGNLGFQRFLVKGLKKVRNMWGMICIAYNLKRMYQLEYNGNRG